MISALRELRLSRLQLALVASLSALAAALIIATALGRTAAQTAAIAALAHRPEIVHIAAVQAQATEPSSGASDSTSSSALASSVAPTPAPAPPPSTSSGATPATSSSSTAGGSGSSTNATTTTTTTTTTTSSQTPASQKHKVGHVFVIALSTTSFEAAFGKGSVAHYLNWTLRRQGTLLGGYESLGSAELPDYLAMASGQAPNSDTRQECSSYAEFPANTKPASNGQVPGTGCVYPNTIITIGDQVTAAGHVWKAFIGDMDPSTCVHPNSNALDNASLPGAGPQYATRHNPFIYFHSLLDLGGCSSNDVSLARLPGALRSLSGTPTYTFIAPRACDDASVQACPAGKPGGLAGEDAFLKQWVPRIRRSAAYRRDGVLVIAFVPGGASTAIGPVPTGALVLSRYAASDKTIAATYTPYSLLRSTEDLLGYKALAHAQAAKSFADTALPGR